MPIISKTNTKDLNLSFRYSPPVGNDTIITLQNCPAWLFGETAGYKELIHAFKTAVGDNRPHGTWHGEPLLKKPFAIRTYLVDCALNFATSQSKKAVVKGHQMLVSMRIDEQVFNNRGKITVDRTLGSQVDYRFTFKCDTWDPDLIDRLKSTLFEAGILNNFHEYYCEGLGIRDAVMYLLEDLVDPVAVDEALCNEGYEFIPESDRSKFTVKAVVKRDFFGDLYGWPLKLIMKLPFFRPSFTTRYATD